MITSREIFYQKLIQNNGFTNETIDLSSQQLTIPNFNSDWITFENCIFNCDTIWFENIKNSKLKLEFRNCTFNCAVSFSNCILDILTINDTKAIKSLDIKKGLSDSDFFEVNVFNFSNVSNDSPELISNFHISNANFKRIFSFENINHIGGKFKFLENKLGNKEKNEGQFMFTNSRFTNAYFF